MKKLFLLLLIIVIATFNAQAATDKTVKCMSLFSKNASAHINDMIVSFEVKRSLLQQTLHSKTIREFVVEFSQLIDQLYITRLAEALDGKLNVDYQDLGFKSANEARVLKETVINKQIKILSIMDSNDMTPEFAADFKIIVTRLHDPETSKKDVLALNERLDSVIRMYSTSF